MLNPFLTGRARRLIFLVTGSAALVLAAWGFWLEPASFGLEERALHIPWSGQRQLRIAVLTDLHVGSPFNGLSRLRRVVALTNASKPDLICVLGDLMVQGVLGGRVILPVAIAAELSKLQAPGGVVAVLGNHDAWFDHDRVRRAMKQAGLLVLEDSAARIDTRSGPVWVAGVSDLWTGRHDIAAALAPVPPDGLPIVLLTHNPDIFPEIPNRVTLTVAGHTHGGQVRLPSIGAPIVPSRFGQRFVAGHIVEGDRHLFVATGVGTSILPVRFRVPPAVVVLTVEQ